MSDDLVPLPDSQPPVAAPSTAIVQPWEAAEPAPAAMPAATSPIERAFAALRRYKFLIVGVVVLASGAGVAATKLVTPQYQVQATIWIQSQTPLDARTGPIRSGELLNATAWAELLRSPAVGDPVVRMLSLYVHPANPSDQPVFGTFNVGDHSAVGAFTLTVDRTRKRWTLAPAKLAPIDSGAAADSVGRAIGFRWVLPPPVFNGSGTRSIPFTVTTPREMAVSLADQLNVRLAPQSSIMWVTLQGPNAQLTARTLNTWANEFVSVASDLKKHNLVEFANILSGQLAYAETALRDAETALQDFKVHTITLPTEGGPVAAGVEETRDPALTSFFKQKEDYDILRHDRESLDKVIADARQGKVPWESVLLIPSVAQSPGAEALRKAFQDSYDQQGKLRAARQLYTDQYEPVQQMIATLKTLQTQTIPQIVGQVRDELVQREGQVDQRVVSQSAELQQIPTRTIEEMRLRRNVTVAEGLYGTLKTRYQEAQLAEASTVADVSVLDTAIAPLRPTKNTKPTILLLAIIGGLGAGIGLALLLDRLDRRIQYPAQATHELGLPISGAVPRLPRGGVNPKSPEQAYQLVEAFRSLRMNVTNAGSLPLSLAVSSPSPSDGKSFIAANLAMSFAEGGFKTLLIDGDTRRGTLNDMFQLARSPGLTDYLAGKTDRSSIIYQTPHRNLLLMPSGKRRRQSPELLSSPALKELIESLRSEYEVIICDTPPFAAGIDAYAIATAAERLVVVLRVGRTQRRMAAAKLLLLERLPVEVVGAVLNSCELDGEFQYYGYVRGYENRDEEEDEPTALLRG